MPRPPAISSDPPEEPVAAYRHVVEEHWHMLWPEQVLHELGGDAYTASRIRMGLCRALIAPLHKPPGARWDAHPDDPHEGRYRGFGFHTAMGESKVWVLTKNNVWRLTTDRLGNEVVYLKAGAVADKPRELRLEVGHLMDDSSSWLERYFLTGLPERRPALSRLRFIRVEVFVLLTRQALERLRQHLTTYDWSVGTPNWEPNDKGEAKIFDVVVPAASSPSGEASTLRAYRWYGPRETSQGRLRRGPYKLELGLAVHDVPHSTMKDPVRALQGIGARWLRRLLRDAGVRRTAKKPSEWNGVAIPKQAMGASLYEEQRHILAQLMGGAPVLTGALRRASGRSASAMSMALKRLEDRGFVVRNKAGPRSTVQITRLGKAAWKASMRAAAVA